MLALSSNEQFRDSYIRAGDFKSAFNKRSDILTHHFTGNTHATVLSFATGWPTERESGTITS